ALLAMTSSRNIDTMRKISPLLVILCASPLLLAGYLWLTMLSPLTYERPAELPPVAQGEHLVFVYGTLRQPLVRWWVFGRTDSVEAAQLQGFRRTGLDRERSANTTVKGLILTVSHEELQRLDRYERVGIRYERRIETLEDGREAWVYQ